MGKKVAFDGCEVKMLSCRINGAALVKSPVAFSAVDKATQGIKTRANAAGDGSFDGDTITGDGGFPHGLVWTADKHACYANRKHNTLVKALGGG